MNPTEQSQSTGSISQGGRFFFVVAGVWLFAIIAARNHDKRSAQHTPAPKPSWQQTSYTFSSSATPSFPSTPAPQSLASLEAWYGRLNAQRQALQLSDTAAIESFNREAARYTAAIMAFRAERAASLSTVTSSSFAPSAYSPDPPPAGNSSFARANSTSGPYYGEFPVSMPVYSGDAYQPGVTGHYYDYSYRPPVGEQYVGPYLRSDGVLVDGHYRTNRDDSFWNNYSSAGNVNPHTGRVGTTLPPSTNHSGSTHVHGYVRSNGTYVAPHFRSK